MSTLRLGDDAPNFTAQTTPVNWEVGEDCVILPSISNDVADKEFPKGYTQIRPYLRLTPQPDL